jgi:hypothetical protein
VAGALGGVAITGAIGLVTALLNHRWQEDGREGERLDRLDDSQASLRRDAYTRFLGASDQLTDFLLTQPPSSSPIAPDDKAAIIARLRAARIGGDKHFVEYNSALLQGSILAGDQVAPLLKEFERWMTVQIATAVKESDPLDSAAFDGFDTKREALIAAMRAEQDNIRPRKHQPGSL